MPTFRTAPSSNLTASIRKLLASGKASPLQEIQVDASAADAAQKMALAEKARMEVEEGRRRAAQQTDPELQTQFASRAAGITDPEGTRLMAHLRGELEQPGTADYQDADIVGRDAQPFPTVAPVIEPSQRGRFQSALAATMANLLATDKTNAEQLTKAGGHLQEQSIVGAVQDAIARGDYQSASAMSQGAKPGTAVKLHDNIGTTGATFAPATGTVRADPAADPTNKLLPASIAAETALAEQRKAAADASRAQAEKARREKPEGAEIGKPPPGYRWGPADDTGNPTLLPISGGPAEKLGETQVKQLVGVQNTRNAITEYRTAIKKFGLTEMMNPNARATMGTVYNNMMLQAKEAYNLGVLNGPDFDILQQVITNPTTLKAGVISKTALDGQAAKLDEIMQRIGITVGAASKQRTGGAAPPGQNVSQRFAADPTVRGMTLGQQLQNGRHEVRDGTGRLVGYYE